jgi:hypothetical protein
MRDLICDAPAFQGRVGACGDGPHHARCLTNLPCMGLILRFRPTSSQRSVNLLCMGLFLSFCFRTS